MGPIDAEPAQGPAASASDDKQPDLDARRKAVEDAASTSGGLWVSYLFVLFYLLISAGAVTHRDLFFEHPVKMPFLNIELPLKGFFWLGPAIFLVVHAYILLHFVVLSGKIDAYNEGLAQLLPGDEDKKARLGLRRLLPTNIFVQFLAGPEDVRGGATGWLLRTIAWISLVVGPVALLVFIQLQFLPYHDAEITWWQRVAVLLDIVLLWVLWPKIDRGQPISNSTRRTLGRWSCLVAASLANLWQRVSVLLDNVLLRVLPSVLKPGQPISDSTRRATGRWLRLVAAFLISLPQRVAAFVASLWHRVTLRVEIMPLWVPGRTVNVGRLSSNGTRHTTGRWMRFVPAFLASLVPIALVFGIATFPGEWLDGVLPRPRVIPRINPAGYLVWRSAYHVLLVGSPNSVTSKPSSPWSNRLVLMGLDGIDRGKFDTDDKIKRARETISLRGRDLRGAVLDRTDLRKADLTRTHLEGASLNGAQLQDVILDYARLQGATLVDADLQGASLRGAQLQDASLRSAHLENAKFGFAELQGASLREAHLQGATLTLEQLEGISLSGAHLQGRVLDDAKFQGASLEGARLQGASLKGANLEGASLEGAHLEGASLEGAHLQGASLARAYFQSARLVYADLRGASLEGAQLQGASLSWARLLGASLDGASLQGTRLAETQLQGASLDGAELEGASFFYTFVWRTRENTFAVGETLVTKIVTGTRWPCSVYMEVASDDGLCEWSKTAFEALTQEIKSAVLEGNRRDEALKRIEALNPEALNPQVLNPQLLKWGVSNPQPRYTDQNIATTWDDHEKHSGPEAEVHKARAKAWRGAGCDAQGAPYVVTALAQWLNIGNPFPKGSSHIADLAAAFLADDCAGARGISGETRSKLQKLTRRAPSPQSAQSATPE